MVEKRPDLNELDVPECAELALDELEATEAATAAHRPLEMAETKMFKKDAYPH
jgi:hypothetical protein